MCGAKAHLLTVYRSDGFETERDPAADPKDLFPRTVDDCADCDRAFGDDDGIIHANLARYFQPHGVALGSIGRDVLRESEPNGRAIAENHRLRFRLRRGGWGSRR